MRLPLFATVARVLLTLGLLAIQACSVAPQKPAGPVVVPSVTTPTVPAEQAPTNNETPVPTDVVPAMPTKLSFAAVGDLMIGTDYPSNTLPDDDGVSYLLQATPLLSAADLALGNLEGVLQDGGKPVKTCQNPKVCYLFRSPTRYAKHFADAGFDVMNLANNHARDFGEDGRSSSMAALDAVGIAHTGRVGDIARLNVKGRDIAVIGFAPNMGAYQLNDLVEARRQVAALVAENRLVIVMFHGGAEGAGAENLPFKHELFQGEDRGDVVEFARALIDEGADLILGSGPHVPRAIEVYKDRLIAYSLGNFATYYGISIAGNAGVAPLLTTELDVDGRFLSGQIHSFVQRRPDGPAVDTDRYSVKLINRLTSAAFPNANWQIRADGSVELVTDTVKSH